MPPPRQLGGKYGRKYVFVSEALNVLYFLAASMFDGRPPLDFDDLLRVFAGPPNLSRASPGLGVCLGHFVHSC